MSTQKLLLDRVEFSTVKVESLQDGDFKRDDVFPQLEFDSDEVKFLTRSALAYTPDEAADPRHFQFIYGIKVDSETAGVKIPYSLEIEAVGYFRYVGGEEFSGADRFRAVRFSGYQILHGAIREMVSNLTARGRHGIWNIPARNFGEMARLKADDDEAQRKELLQSLEAKVESAAPVKKRTRKKKSDVE
jgi:preprotein translocase subunit SecB